MKHNFNFYYLIDAPLHAVVGAYLDCEHFEHIHKTSVDDFKVLSYKDSKLVWHQRWNILGLSFKQIFTTEYILPATFLNSITAPADSSVLNIYRFLKINTKGIFAPHGNQTITITQVSLDIPFYVYPFRKILEYVIIKLKVILDLEDVATLDRKRAVFGKLAVGPFIHPEQFLIFKEEFDKVFKNKENFSFDYDSDLITSPPELVTELKYPYVKKFMKKGYYEISGFSPKEIP